jgi:hypothetical protein
VKDVQTTNNLGLKKPGAEDVVNIEDLNSNSDELDGKFGASSGHGHTGVAGDGPKIGSNGLAAGAATDTVIGSRTVSDTTAPTGDSGTPTTLFGWLANMIKAITGGATWRTLPGMTIAAIKTILDAATNAGTASTLMKRDSSGRAQVAAPSAAADIARKDTVDAVQSNLNTHATLSGSAHGATAAPTVSTLMARDSAGRAQVVTPSVAADIANKGYVDSTVSGATIPDASLTIKGKVQLSNAVNSTSEVLAATPKAVKDAYDRGSAGVTAATAAQSTANAAQATANGAAQGRGEASSDLNTVVNPGSYNLSIATSFTNRPPGMPDWCLMTVEPTGVDGAYIKQTVHNVWGQIGYTFARIRTESSWSGWYREWNSFNDSQFVRGRATVLTTGDFNNFVSPGVYDVVNFSGTNSPPDHSYGTLVVHLDQYYLMQEFTANNNQNSRSYRVRTDSGSWSPWRSMQSARLTDSDSTCIIVGYTDINNLIRTGFYMGDNMVNAPTAAWYYVQVMRHSDGYVYQKITELNPAGLVALSYERIKNNGTWGGWISMGGIKSIQRGETVTTTESPYIRDITISAVNMAKTQVNLLSSVLGTTYSSVSLILLNPTTLRVKSQVSAGYNISWEVIEFY